MEQTRSNFEYVNRRVRVPTPIIAIVWVLILLSVFLYFNYDKIFSRAKEPSGNFIQNTTQAVGIVAVNETVAKNSSVPANYSKSYEDEISEIKKKIELLKERENATAQITRPRIYNYTDPPGVG